MNKRKRIITIAAVLAAVSMNMTAQPAQRTLWNDGWTFTKDGESRVLDLPHDWGVDGPFVQEYPGETGKLAWWGKAEYSKILSVTAKDLRSGKRFLLDFGGAMSYAKVFCNVQITLVRSQTYSSEDIVFVDVKVADRDGNMVPTASDRLKFSVSGPGEIVAVDAGDATCHTPFRSDEIKAFGGLASVIVRRTGSGTVILRAESEGLEAGETEL